MSRKNRRIAVVVMSDEHSGLALSSAGHPWIRTAHLDAFAGGNTRFACAYTNSPICIPARAAFMTGRYTHETRHWDNAMPYTGAPRGWAHALRDAGFDVTSIGKLHFRNAQDDTGFTRQLLPMHVVDGVGDLLGAVRHPLPVRHKSKALAEQVGIGESDYTRYDRAIAQRSVQWIREHAATDGWVLFASFVAPHFPLIAPHEFASRYQLADIPLPKLSDPSQRKDHPWITALRGCFPHDDYFDDTLRRRALLSYAGLCGFMDWHFECIRAALEECGLADEALLLYTADHGDNMGARGLWGKSTHYEESARVPMLLRAPGRALLPVVETAVSLVDVAPTLLDWMGLDAPTDWPGRSLMTLGGANDAPERAVFAQYHAAGAQTASYMLRQGPWKLVHYTGLSPELYHLQSDPQEMVDLSTAPGAQGVLRQLTAALHSVVHPEAADRQARADQDALIAAHGGSEAVLLRGGFGATPAPGVAASYG